MREPLEVFALDESFVRATGSIPYKSLRWVRRYTKPGEFEMVVPVNIYDPSWSYICCDLRPELGIIQKVQFDDDVQSYAGIDSVTLSGFFLESVLNNIVFLDESPEEQKVYVPEPRRPSYRKSQNPKVYHDNAGGWYYTNSSGQITDAETGRTGISEEGLTEVDYRDAQGTNWGGDTTYCDFDYYASDDKTQINRVTWSGGTETYDVLFSDDRGNVFYTDPSAPSRVAQAVGVVTSRGDTYTERKRRWDALSDDEYGSYYTVTVKGPWQRTDAMEPITAGDSIDIVFKWARRMMGNWLLYEEPTIEGVQKAVDPSFQYLGDLLYKTLYEVGASLRLEYLFLSNTFILSTYRGYDRTRNSLPEASARAVPMAAAATTSGIPDGYTQPIYQPGGLYTLTGMDDALYAQWESDEPGPGPGPKPPASTAPLAVFSDTWGTIYGYSASRDESNYRNTCYVLYEYDEPSSFDADGLPSVSYENSFDGEQSDGAPSFAGINVWIPYTTRRGYDVAHVGDDDEPSMETYLDIRGEKPPCDNQWSRDSVFVQCTRSTVKKAIEKARAQLINMDSGSTAPTGTAYRQWAESIPERGVQYLNEEYGVLVNLDTGTVNADGYLRDFDLGDMVDFEVSTVGLVETGRVIEVEEVYETPSGNKPVASINVSIGDSLLTSTMAKHLA